MPKVNPPNKLVRVVAKPNSSHQFQSPKSRNKQDSLVFDEGKGLSTEKQLYDPTPIINELRYQVDQWRKLSNPGDWLVSPETATLLQHWRQFKFNNVRPFFCQVEAVETAIWLTEVAPKIGKSGKRFLEHLDNANRDANPELSRLALKLATGAGKTTVMAMIIAWQTINAIRRSGSSNFTRGFLVVTPGLTIRDRLRVLLPNDPDNYYSGSELVPSDMCAALALTPDKGASLSDQSLKRSRLTTLGLLSTNPAKFPQPPFWITSGLPPLGSGADRSITSAFCRY
jgi:type III restriction enzyme